MVEQAGRQIDGTRAGNRGLHTGERYFRKKQQLTNKQAKSERNTGIEH